MRRDGVGEATDWRPHSVRATVSLCVLRHWPNEELDDS